MSFLRQLKSRVSFKLLLSVLLAILIVAAALTATAFYFIQNSYLEFYTANVLLTNRLVASQISAEALKPYIEALEGDPLLYAQQKGYAQTRARLFALEEEGESGTRTQEYVIGKMQQNAFKDQMQRYKDEEYYAIQEHLDDLRDVSGARYLYIFADTGAPGSYTYLFDAHTAEEADDIDRDDYGTVNYYEDFVGAQEVFDTGRQMTEAIYEDNPIYGTLYYVYSPLIDASGEVVAIVGTDIDLHEMRTQLQTILWVNMLVVLFIISLTIVVLFVLLRRIVVRPLEILTREADQAARGELAFELSPAMLRRSDEIGQLSRSFADMIRVSGRMQQTTQAIFEAVQMGRMDARTNPADFEGSYALIATQMNETLDTLNLYFDSVPEAMCIIGDQLQMIYRNRRYMEVFHHVLTGQLVRQALGATPDAQNAALFTELNRRADLNAYIATITVPSPQGEARSYSILAKRLEPRGHTTGTLLIASDITDFLLATERAEAANWAKTEFLSRTSHELRTPLNVILGLTNLALRDSSLDAKTRETFESISTASHQLLRIISDVLDMSRMESGKLEIHIEDMSLPTVLSECFDMMEVTAGEKDVSLTEYRDPGLPEHLLGDEVRVRQILLNLLSNALKFTDAGGHVHLDTHVQKIEGQDAWISMSVRDDGIGMSEAFLQKIFNPFEQEDQFLQRRFEGNGLGLSISHALAKLMGGDLRVASELGKGSRFELLLPMRISAPTEPEHSQKTGEGPDLDDDLQGVRLLLVDDIEINRSIVVELFEGSGILIDEAGDGLEAVRIFSGSPEFYYDLILMDIQMPRMNGYEATQQIRAMQREDASLIPIIAMTANALREDVERAKAAGMTDHLSKPIDFDLCEQMIRKYARHK